MLKTGDGTHLWDTVTAADTIDDGTLRKDEPARDRNLPKMGEAIVDRLHAFVGQ